MPTEDTPPPDASWTFGQRVQRHRQRSGLTRAVLGGLVGRSGEWVKAIERDRLRMPGVPMLMQLADVLGIEDWADLTGDARLSKVAWTKRAHESLDTVRTALATYPLAADEPVHPDAYAARVSRAWTAWHGTRQERGAVAPLLPGLLADGRAAVRALDGDERRQAARLLAQVYHLTQLYCTFQPAPELVYMTGDRAMAAAQDADDPVAVAGAAWYLNHVWRDAGEAAEARVQLALDVTGMLRPEASTEHLALHSLMHLATALSHAKIGRDGDAWRHHDEAHRAADALDGYVHPWLMVGTGMVEHYAVTIHLDLQQPGRALQAARRIDPAAIPSRTRQSRYHVEVARAHHREGDADGAVYQMLKARDVSHDTYAFSLFARGIVADLLPAPPATVATDVRDLAHTLNLSVEGA